MTNALAALRAQQDEDQKGGKAPQEAGGAGAGKGLGAQAPAAEDAVVDVAEVTEAAVEEAPAGAPKPVDPPK